MLRDDVVNLLTLRLGNRKNFTDHVLAEMEHTQRNVLEVNEWLPWFLETEMASTMTVAGERRVPLPGDFLMEVEEQHLYYVSPEGKDVMLGKADYDFLMNRYTSTAAGPPKHYALGAQFYLFPVPDGIYKIRQRYYAMDTSMVQANAETKWLRYASDLVIAVTGKQLAQKHLQNPTLAQSFAEDVPAAWARLLHKHTAMQEINQSRVAGSES
jgi:hypothetical protein